MWGVFTNDIVVIAHNLDSTGTMALSKVKGTLERVLDKNLQDLVRGIRNHKENEVSGCCGQIILHEEWALIYNKTCVIKVDCINMSTQMG